MRISSPHIFGGRLCRCFVSTLLFGSFSGLAFALTCLAGARYSNSTLGTKQQQGVKSPRFSSSALCLPLSSSLTFSLRVVRSLSWPATQDVGAVTAAPERPG